VTKLQLIAVLKLIPGFKSGNLFFFKDKDLLIKYSGPFFSSKCLFAIGSYVKVTDQRDFGPGLNKDWEGIGRGSLFSICFASGFYLYLEIDFNTDRSQSQIKLYEVNTTQSLPGYIPCRLKACSLL
jgi:hypothetical protein